MKNINRRDFLKQAMAGIGAAAVPIKTIEVFGKKKFTADDRIILGKTGIEVSRLSLGSGTVGWKKQSNQTKLGMEKFVSQIRYGFERGITFWDSADQYGSHPYFGRALKHVPREKITILTKSNSKNASDLKSDIERFKNPCLHNKIWR